MKLFEFDSHFKDEEACKQAFRENKEEAGIVCPRCGCVHHYWIGKGGGMHQCKRCGYRQSLKSNTLMHGSKLPFRSWFIAFHLLTATQDETFSAREIQRQLNMKRYQPAWEMCHKIREAMGKSDQERLLRGPVEIDEGFLTTQRKEEEKGQELKRGAGSQAKAKVLVMAESKPAVPTKKGQRARAVREIKMLVIPDLKAGTVAGAALEAISTDAELVSDATSSHNLLPGIFKSYDGRVIKPEDVGNVLTWVHHAIRKIRSELDYVHNVVKREYLQEYLSEYTWRFNRRALGEGQFDAMVLVASRYKNGFMHRRYSKCP